MWIGLFLVDGVGLAFCAHQQGLLNLVNLIIMIALHFGHGVLLTELVLLHELIKLHEHLPHPNGHQPHQYEHQQLSPHSHSHDSPT